VSRPGDRPVLIHRLIARLNVGGPAMHVVNLAAAMNEGPWRTRLIAGRIEEDEGDMAYYADELGVDISYVPAMARSINPLADFKTLVHLYRLFRRERPDIVHTHTAKAGTLGRIAAVLAGVPVRVHTYHGHVLGGSYFAPWKTAVFVFIEQQLGRLSDRLVVLTRRQAQEMADELRVAPPSKFSVVPLGLDLERFLSIRRDGDAAAARAALGAQEGEVTVGIVGRMVPVKNHELFFDVVAELVNVSPAPVRAFVVGSGERQAELETLVEALGIHANVTWLGWRQDLEEIYPALDVMLLTSHDEGTPVAVIEALVSGTPVVARDVGGVAEMLGEADAGTVVSRGAGVSEWARSVIAAAGEAPGEEVRGAVAGRFSVDRLARNVTALYQVGIK